MFLRVNVPRYRCASFDAFDAFDAFEAKIPLNELYDRGAAKKKESLTIELARRLA